jgi:hypothetical protein
MQLVIHNIRLDLYTTIHIKSTNPAQTFESDGTSSTSNSTVITCLKSRSPRDNSFPPRLYHRISSVSIRQDVCFQGAYKAPASVTCMDDRGPLAGQCRSNLSSPTRNLGDNERPFGALLQHCHPRALKEASPLASIILFMQTQNSVFLQ